MNTPSRSLPLSGLRAVHNARMRIFAAGRDPLFEASPQRRAAATDWLHRSSTEPATPHIKLWRPDLLDRLQSSMTRYRD